MVPTKRTLVLLVLVKLLFPYPSSSYFCKTSQDHSVGKNFHTGVVRSTTDEKEVCHFYVTWVYNVSINQKRTFGDISSSVVTQLCVLVSSIPLSTKGLRLQSVPNTTLVQSHKFDSTCIFTSVLHTGSRWDYSRDQGTRQGFTVNIFKDWI